MNRTKNKTTATSTSRAGSGVRERAVALHTTPMKTMGLFEASKKFQGMRFEKTRELTPTESALWDQAKRGRGRPKKAPGDKVARVLVSIAPGLLAEADDYARRQGISRAELFARGLMKVLPGRG